MEVAYEKLGFTYLSAVLAHEPLRVSLEDLHSAGSKGKWWLVGAAWGGDPLLDRQREATSSLAPKAIGQEEAATNALVRLARKHGMNTDIRRSVFVVLMSSDVSVRNPNLKTFLIQRHAPQDYVDACERLSQLNLTELQQREVVRVALHCCGNVSSIHAKLHVCSLAWLGKDIQSVLHSCMSTALQNIALPQNHTAILSLGFSS